MPTKAVAAETMEVGKKGGGKHWTAEQVAARKAAANVLKRKDINLTPPDSLNSGALFVWKKIVDDAASLGDGSLLDNLDVYMLAFYCEAIDKAQTLNKKMMDGQSPLSFDDDTKMLQGWYRIISTYADKLGFTPQARARLVKVKANDVPKDKFGDTFD